MNRTHTPRVLPGLAVAALASAMLAALASTPASAAGTDYSNPASVSVTDTNPAPGENLTTSTITVAGQPTLTDVNVTLKGISSSQPENLDILLEGPTGIKVMLLSDIGGPTPANGSTLSFDDAAATTVADTGGLPNGTFKPTNEIGSGNDGSLVGGALLSAFNGTNPNGVWKLRFGSNGGGNLITSTLAGSWSLNLNPAAPPPPCNGLTPTIVGTPGNDSITGTAGNDVIVALGGDDTVIASGGNDTVCGGDGNDVLKGGDGKDKLFGEAGNDALKGGAGVDKCKGGDGTDKARTCERIRQVP